MRLSEKYGLDVQLDKLITEISVGEQQRTRDPQGPLPRGRVADP